ncbi:hypothetical protein [Intestinibacter sp.]|uniref:hypothetical protein n=1 Tax=Intestinibacter sp. TaxID=1965304 RepID=UPI003F18BD8C
MDKNERKEDNLKILKKLESYLNKYPDIRFIQALWSLHIVDELDRFYEEPSITIKRMVNKGL